MPQYLYFTVPGTHTGYKAHTLLQDDNGAALFLAIWSADKARLCMVDNENRQRKSEC